MALEEKNLPSHHVDVLDKGDKKFSQFKHSIIVSCYSHLALVCLSLIRLVSLRGVQRSPHSRECTKLRKYPNLKQILGSVCTPFPLIKPETVWLNATQHKCFSVSCTCVQRNILRPRNKKKSVS